MGVIKNLENKMHIYSMNKKEVKMKVLVINRK